MKTKILIAILTVGVFTISTVKAQEKPMNMKQDTMKMNHSKMKMMDKSKEMEIKHETMKIDSMYTCPMHADMKSDKPGACPKCGMDLKMMDMKMNHSNMEMKHDSMHMNQRQSAKTYVCPMHPDQVSNKPGKCPSCGMAMALKAAKAPVKQQ
jgi:transcription initiation factor IIE alpha subunit